MPCQDLIQSITTQQLGSTTMAARAWRALGPGGPGRRQRPDETPGAGPVPRSRRQAASPTPAHGRPSTITTSKRPGPRLGISQYRAISRYPAPNHQPRIAASRPVGAARSSSSPGTRPHQARNSRLSDGKASTGTAPASKAAYRAGRVKLCAKDAPRPRGRVWPAPAAPPSAWPAPAEPPPAWPGTAAPPSAWPDMVNAARERRTRCPQGQRVLPRAPGPGRCRSAPLLARPAGGPPLPRRRLAAAPRRRGGGS